MHDWIDELCDVLDVELDVDESLIVDVAREAAENVGDAAGPVSAFLLGYAAARSDGDSDDLEELAEAAMDLASRWDKTSDEIAHADDDPEVESELADA